MKQFTCPEAPGWPQLVRGALYSFKKSLYTALGLNGPSSSRPGDSLTSLVKGPSIQPSVLSPQPVSKSDEKKKKMSGGKQCLRNEFPVNSNSLLWKPDLHFVSLLRGDCRFPVHSCQLIWTHSLEVVYSLCVCVTQTGEDKKSFCYRMPS